jgi:hypothetical protein
VQNTPPFRILVYCSEIPYALTLYGYVWRGTHTGLVLRNHTIRITDYLYQARRAEAGLEIYLFAFVNIKFSATSQGTITGESPVKCPLTFYNTFSYCCIMFCRITLSYNWRWWGEEFKCGFLDCLRFLPGLWSQGRNSSIRSFTAKYS